MEIPLTQGKVAIIDDADAAIVSAFRWYAQKHRHTFYAIANVQLNDGTKDKTGRSRRTTIKMHRLLLGLSPTERTQVDHEDGDGLNNRRSNLRQCAHADNQHNQHAVRALSGLKGVYPSSLKSKPWTAAIKHNGRNITLGCFATKREAAIAYNVAAKLLFGKFAAPNVA